MTTSNPRKIDKSALRDILDTLLEEHYMAMPIDDEMVTKAMKDIYKVFGKKWGVK